MSATIWVFAASQDLHCVHREGARETKERAMQWKRPLTVALVILVSCVSAAKASAQPDGLKSRIEDRANENPAHRFSLQQQSNSSIRATTTDEAGERGVGLESNLALEAERARASRSALEDQKDDPAAWAHLPADFGKSFGAFFSEKNVLPAAVIGLVTAAAWRFDSEVQEYWGERERLGESGKIAGNKLVLVGAFGGLMTGSRLVDNERFRLMSYDLLLGFAVNNAVTFALKAAAQRERPDGGNFSFPSGHASNLFTAARIIGQHYGLKVGIPLYLFATFVSIARLDENSHWMSDTVAGAGLGLMVGNSILRRSAEPTGSRRVTWMPVLSETVVGIRFSVNP